MVGHGPQSAPQNGANLYDLLALTPEADEDAIREAIARQRRVWRRRTTAPEIVARQEAERRMQSLDEAERTLLDPVRRGSYDARLRTLASIQPGEPESNTGQFNSRVGGRHAASSAEPAARQVAPLQRQQGPDDRWLVRAIEQLDREQYDVAAFTARRAVEADPENAYAWSVFAEAATRSGDTKTARAAIDRALSLDPESAQLHAQRGWILDQAGDLRRAYSAYVSAGRLAADRPDYRVRAVLVLLRAGRVDEAVTDAEAAYQAHPDDGEIRSALGAALAERAVAAQHELPDGRLVISTPSQASYVLALANRGLSVHPPDPDVLTDLQRQRDYARRAMRRRFSTAAFRRNYKWPLGLGLLTIAVVCCAPNVFSASSGSPLGAAAFQLVFGVFAIAVLAGLIGSMAFTCFEPQFRRNAKLVEHTVPRRKGRGPGEGARSARQNAK